MPTQSRDALPVAVTGTLALTDTTGAALPFTAANPNGNPTTGFCGRATVTTTATAVGTGALVNGLWVKAMEGNAATVYVGPAGVTTANGYPLAAGNQIWLPLSNLNQVRAVVVANGTDVVAWVGN